VTLTAVTLGCLLLLLLIHVTELARLPI